MSAAAKVRVAGAAMPLTSDHAWRALHAAASALYRDAGPYALHFARGKLGGDPAFRRLVDSGVLAAAGHVLDIGCGQGLLGAVLNACSALQRRGGWPAAWGPAPAPQHYTGIELMPQDVMRAQKALATANLQADVVQADMRQAALPRCDVAVLLDVLHYIPPSDQQALLQRVREALAPQGRLVMRVGDAGRRRGYRFSQAVDRLVARLRGLKIPTTWGRPLAEWTQLLQQLGFTVRTVPMREGPPFANVLLVAELSGANE